MQQLTVCVLLASCAWTVCAAAGGECLEIFLLLLKTFGFLFIYVILFCMIVENELIYYHYIVVLL